MNKQNFLSAWEPALLQHKQYLISFAFRMTGSLSEAEDIVQDTFIECAYVDPANINNPRAWLTKVCSNKGLDHLKSAYKKRETYPGVWLPDAIPESLELEAEFLLAESATTGFLLLAEKLSPEERVVYLLFEVFGYSFKEIAEILEKSADACKKIAQRARAAVKAGNVKYAGTRESQAIVAAFFEALKQGDNNKLLQLLSADSELWADGGGKVPVASDKVISDMATIARFFARLGKSSVFHSENFRAELHNINFRPGLVVSKKLASGGWEFDTLISFEIPDEKIRRIYAQRNPDKLRSLTTK